MDCRRALLAVILALVVPPLSPALAQIARPVADIDTTREDLTDPLFTEGFAVLGTSVFFLQDDGIHGVEIWKTDGTAAGTSLLKDVCPGACWSWPRELTVWNGALYFTAEDGVHGRELWRSDGTPAGTAMVKDLWPGLSSSDPSLLPAGGVLYLSADDGIHGRELWKTDGTAAGTQLVADIQPGPAGSDPVLLLDTGGGLLLSADDGVHGREPWLSDGTAPGTSLLLDVQPGAAGSLLTSPASFYFERETVALGGGAFLFVADDGVHGFEPWVSDGTPGGTALLKDVNPGSDSSLPHGFLRLGGRILFGAFEPSTGTELWSTDGTAAGTALVKDVDPNVDNGNIRALTAVGGEAYFASFDGTPGLSFALWKTDGTAAGTVEMAPASTAAFSIELLPVIQPFNGGVLFFGQDAAHGIELWKSDGTPAGTVLVKDVEPGPRGSIGFGDIAIAVAAGTAYFRGTTLAHGSELWKTDGTDAGTAEVKNIQALASSLRVFNGVTEAPFQSVAGKVLFAADDGATGVEPWVSDGTAAGTSLLADLAPGPDWSSPLFALPVGGTNVLGAYTGLWATDGTTAGTTQILPASIGSVYNPASALGKVFFTAEPPGTGDPGLWWTDGTAAGTAPAGGIGPAGLTPFGPLVLYSALGSSGDLYPRLWRTDGTTPGTFPLTAPNPALGGMVALSSVALFAADSPGAGTELWKTDGTLPGTGFLADLQPGPGSSAPGAFVRLGSRAVFTATDPAHGRELWASDGTAAGTALIADIQPGSGSAFGAYPTGLFALPGAPAIAGGALFFVADDGTHGRELWKTDGTAAGTGLVLDILPGAGSAEPTDLTVAAGRVFFVADDGVHGRELWVSDGTAAGTRMVADIFPGAGSPAIQGLLAVRHLVLFSADDGVHGRELWRSDGGAVGTFLVQDIAPGAEPSSPLDMIEVGANVFFAANDGVTGFEPWVVSKSDLLTTFQDVPPSYWAWNAIEALASYSLTNGCAAGSYCPDLTITRAEMAVFLGRALHGPGFVPPPATGTRFGDVPADFWAAPWIELIAADGLSNGCSSAQPLFCPTLPVTRAEMAVFLLRARHGGSYVPPPVAGTRFTDVPPDYWAAAWIEQLAAEGITNGCATGYYCPAASTNRAEAAVFLARTFNLPLP
jgi:ELWxxDGT repeat protein